MDSNNLLKTLYNKLKNEGFKTEEYDEHDIWPSHPHKRVRIKVGNYDNITRLLRLIALVERHQLFVEGPNTYVLHYAD